MAGKKIVSLEEAKKTKKKKVEDEKNNLAEITEDIRRLKEEIYEVVVSAVVAEVLLLIDEDLIEKITVDEFETTVELSEDLFISACDDEEFRVLYNPIRVSEYGKTTSLLRERVLEEIRKGEEYILKSYDEENHVLVLGYLESKESEN